MTDSPAGLTAIISGGSSGIGKATAETLMHQGYAVAICARDLSGVQRATDDLSSAGQCIGRSVDVADRAAVHRFVDETVATFGRLDAVINCAGVTGAQVPLLESGDDEWDAVLSVNLYGPLNMIRAAAPHLAVTKGSVVSVSSVNAHQAEPLMAPYGVSKSALEALTRYAACELATHGIRVNAVAPGWVRTRLSEPALADMGLLGRSFRSTMQQRAADPREVAEVIAFAASRAASYLTGTTIIADGGQLPLMAQPEPIS